MSIVSGNYVCSQINNSKHVYNKEDFSQISIDNDDFVVAGDTAGHVYNLENQRETKSMDKETR